jgi:hypothetical protein
MERWRPAGHASATRSRASDRGDGAPASRRLGGRGEEPRRRRGDGALASRRPCERDEEPRQRQRRWSAGVPPAGARRARRALVPKNLGAPVPEKMAAFRNERLRQRRGHGAPASRRPDERGEEPQQRQRPLSAGCWFSEPGATSFAARLRAGTSTAPTHRVPLRPFCAWGPSAPATQRPSAPATQRPSAPAPQRPRAAPRAAATPRCARGVVRCLRSIPRPRPRASFGQPSISGAPTRPRPRGHGGAEPPGAARSTRVVVRMGLQRPKRISRLFGALTPCAPGRGLVRAATRGAAPA